MERLFINSFRMIAMLLLCGIIIRAHAACLWNVPQTLKQPNGETLECLASGDEYYHRLHDKDGYTIVLNPESHCFVYAAKSGEGLIPTDFIAGKVNPTSIGLERSLAPSPNDAFHGISAVPNTAPLEGPGKMPKVGVLNNIVIFVRFSDESEFTDQILLYNNMFNSMTPGTSSLLSYFMEASYGQLMINSSFYPNRPGTTVVSVQNTQPRDYYRPYDAVLNPIGYATAEQRISRMAQLIKHAVESVSSQIPSSLDVDADSDGWVDNVCVTIKGAPDAWGDLLWSRMGGLADESTFINGKKVGTFTMQFQSVIDSGVLCHEMFHALSAPDLYRYTNDSIRPVGSWDLMSHHGTIPQHMGAYMKWKYGNWISTIPSITTAGTYTLNPVTSSTNNCYKIASPNSTTEYFIIEYRRQTGTYESNLPGSGLLVYRINSTTGLYGNSSGPPDEIYIYRPNGTTTVDGQVNQAHFSAESGRTAIDDTTNPSSFLSDGGPGGLRISQVGTAGSTISFRVDFAATERVTAPTFSPDGGTYASAPTVNVSCDTPGAVIRYTTNGMEPTEADSVVVSGATILLEKSLTLRARAWKTGMEPSDIKTSAYTIGGNPHIYVKQDAPGPVHDGLSWITAYTTISQGVSTATSGTEIWVAVGFYPEKVTMKSGVSLYGGFSGTETAREKRNWAVNRTVVDRNYQSGIIYAASSISEPTRVDGFVIQRGQNMYGGGIECWTSQLIIANNVIQMNTGSYGGGIGAIMSSPTIINNLIKDNTGTRGAGVLLYNSSSLLAGNTIVSNNALTNGIGGVHIYFAGYPTVTNNIIAFNSHGLSRNDNNPVPACSNNCYFGNTFGDLINLVLQSTEIQQDPLFVGHAAGNHHLQSGSPCVDKGNDSVVQTSWLDMNCWPRILGPHVDIGAYEVQPISQYFTSGNAVKAGKWNCISVPADPVNPNPLAVFFGVDIMNASFQFWKNDTETGGFQSYGELFGWTGPVRRGTPYWFLEVIGSDKDISYQGLQPVEDFVLTIPSRNSAPYWIMLGTPFPTAVHASDIRLKNLAKRGEVWLTWQEAFSEVDPNLRIVDSNAQGWNFIENRFDSIAPPPWTAPKSQFDPWWGYWMLVYDRNELKILFPKP